MKIYRRFALLAVAVLLLCNAGFSLARAPLIEPVEDGRHLGDPRKFLFWTPEQQVAGYRNIQHVFPTRVIPAGGSVLELTSRPLDLSDVSIVAGDRILTVDEYFLQQSVAGLLVIKDGNLVYERYGLGNTLDSVWVSFSVAKSVTSMLIGAALQDGYIKSVDDKVTDYLPRLKNSAYDEASIRNVLQMSSGVSWNEDYADPASDVNSADWTTLGLYEYLRHKSRHAAPGEQFNYNTAETNLAGTLLRAAIGNNLATYLSEKIWRPLGMQADANWMLTETGGGESGGCCISATLRDYARLGLFALNDGRLADGTRVLPENWMRDSTAPSKGDPGYGYFWWLKGSGVFEAVGIFGQAIHVNRNENLVIALHSARGVASKDADWALQSALFAAITKATGQ